MHDSMSAARVALLVPCLLTGGTEVATLGTALALQSRDFTVEVIVYFDEIDATMLETFVSAGIFVHLLDVKREGALPAVRLALGLLLTLWRGRFGVVWVQYMTPTLLPLLVARLFTRNLIAAVHVAASHYSISGLARMRWLACHWCARFVCVSQTVANGVFGSVDGPQRMNGRVVVLPNALDMTSVRAASARDWRAELGWPADAVVLGYAGRLAQNKGVDILLNAVAQMLAQGLPVRLVVVGDGAEMADLRLLACRLGIDAITHFEGRVSRASIYGAIKGFDIAAVPSREEGFGLSALEAMAAGVPVVASRVDALQEVVREEVTGLLVPVADPVNLADALAHLVGDAALRKSMGVAGVDHVLRLYDVPAYRARLAALLADLGLSYMRMD